VSQDTIPIWSDPDVQRIYDIRDGRPWPRFAEFNGKPGQLQAVREFVEADQTAGSDGPAESYVQACLAGVRAVERLDGEVDPGWIKFFLFQIDQINLFLWDLHRRSAEVAAVAEWTVVTIEKHQWGPDGPSTAIGQVHSGAMALAAQAGGGLRQNPATDSFEYGDGSEARKLAGVTDRPLATEAVAEVSQPQEDSQVAADELLIKRLEEAQDGDRTGLLVVQAIGANDRGDHAKALELFEQAARLGDVNSMVEVAMIYMSRSDLESARFWFESSAKAGYTKSFSYLAKLAEQAGDQEREREWSRRGAEAGDTWAMGNYAYFLLNDAVQVQQRGAPERDVMELLRACREYAVRAAGSGQVNAMYSAGLSSVFLGDRSEGRRWLEQAEENGHPDARGMIDRFGLR
jgi:TPR repeat protein